MSTLRIHFTSGKSCDIRLEEEQDVAGLMKSLATDNNGMTSVTANYQPSFLINRAQITHVTVEK